MIVGDTYTIPMQCKALDTSKLPREEYALTDPTTIEVVVTAPSGSYTYTLANGDVKRVSKGVYYLHVPCTESGQWSFRITTTGDCGAAKRGRWQVGE